MKLPFVKRSTVKELQRKLDQARASLKRKDQQIKTTQSKVKEARKKSQVLQEELDKSRDALQTSQWRLEQAQRDHALSRELAQMHGREVLSLRFLKGQGLEVGALHFPTKTAPGTVTKYYDYTTAEESGRRFPELLKQGHKMVEVDYVGDGEKLDLIADGSLDYIIANHMLEHCQDVIGTLKNFWRKLRMGGALLLSLPDKRYTFDFRRPRTPFEHLVRDHLEGPRQSLFQHYTEFHQLATTNIDYLKTEEAVFNLPHVDIHFHVWTMADIIEMFLRLGAEHGFNWEIDGMLREGIEVVTVLRKEEVKLWDRGKPETKPEDDK